MAAILLPEVLLEGIVPRQPLARGQQSRQRIVPRQPLARGQQSRQQFDLLEMDNK